MGDRINNMNNMMKNPQQRNMYLSVVGLAVVTLIVGIWYTSKGVGNQGVPAGANVAAVPGINVIPGTSASPQYNQDVQRQNETLSAIAQQTGTSFIPTPVNNNAFSNTSPIDEMERQRAQNRLEEERLAQLKFEEEERIRNAPPPQPIIQPVVQQVAVQEPIKTQKYGADDYMLLSTLLGVWGPKTPSSEFDFARQTARESGAGSNQSNNALSQENQNLQGGNPNSSGGTQPNQMRDAEVTVGRAGTIYQAILETAINSDEPSPVLARIVTGPLAGTRLLGSMRRTGEKVLVEFNTATIPGKSNSASIIAVAVDPNSSRTALASDVDRHYFLRYGVLLASAFLGGYADAISRQNTTTSVTPDGNVVQTTGELSSKDISKQAIGSVGKTLAQQVEQQVQGLQPTVTVNSGSAIGILLMADLNVKK